MSTAKKAAKKKVPAKKGKAKGKGRPSNLPKTEKPEYGVDALAKALGVTALTTRNKLRASGDDSLIKKFKAGRVYDFGSAANVAAVVKKLAA